MRRQWGTLLVIVSAGFFVNSVTYADPVPLSTATGVSFQNEGTLQADHMSLLTALDGQWAPSMSGTVQYDYYATGSGSSHWDVVSLTFDLSSIGWRNVAAAELWFYVQQGDYFRPE